MEEKEQVSVLQVETGSTPQVTSASGTTSLTIDTSASSLATNRSHRTSSPTVQQNSVLPSVSPPSTSTTVATATGRSSTTVQEAPLSIIIVHFEGYGGSPRTHTASTTVRGGGGGGQYRDAMQHHEQFRRAVQELAIPVREVCSLMPVLNAMCCIVEDPSGLWKLAQVPVVKHLWKGGVAGIPPRESSSAMAMAMIQSALASSFSSSSPSTPLPPQPQQHQHPQYQGHVKDDRDRERVDISSDDVCAGQQPAFSFSPPSSSSSSSSSSLPTCTASIPVFSRSLPRTLPVAQGQDEDDKDRGRAWMEAPTSVNTPDIDKVAKEGRQGGTSHLLVSSDWQDGEQ
ncbi:hypothetical protein MVEG_01551 [Podila verticillata NRRL 6337]|nr:hypothetical protein MVEG_01551 [Podila verticillata NRRL 6337]